MDYMTAHRLKVLAFALLYLLGCNNPDVPTPGPDQAIEIKVPAFNDDQDVLAYTLAQHTQGTPSPTPGPGPSPVGPKVGDKCEECRGTGQLGDSTVFRPCPQCKADGRLDEGDPGLSSSSQEKTEEEHSVVVEYAREDAFNEWVAQFDEFKSKAENKHNELVQTSNENNAAVQAKFDELNGRISELEARLQAVDDECTCDEKPAQVETPQVGYRINYKGDQYVWQGGGVFQNATGWKITYPHLKNATPEFLEANPDVRVCPEGEVCVETKIEKYDPSTDAPLIMSAPKNEPSPPSTPQTFYDPYYPIRPSYTWWSGCHSWVHMTQGEHRGRFNPDWLRRLDWPELQSVHSDAHDGRVKWQYVMR